MLVRTHRLAQRKAPNATGLNVRFKKVMPPTAYQMTALAQLRPRALIRLDDFDWSEAPVGPVSVLCRRMSAAGTPSKANGSADDRFVFRADSAAARLDGRTRGARRRQVLVRTYAAELGGWAVLSPTMQLRIEAAAELQVTAELLRARTLAGEIGLTDQLVKIQNVAERAFRQLGFAGQHTKPAAPNLDEYLRAKALAAGATP